MPRLYLCTCVFLCVEGRLPLTVQSYAGTFPICGPNLCSQPLHLNSAVVACSILSSSSLLRARPDMKSKQQQCTLVANMGPAHLQLLMYVACSDCGGKSMMMMRFTL